MMYKGILMSILRKHQSVYYTLGENANDGFVYSHDRFCTLRNAVLYLHFGDEDIEYHGFII